MTEALLISNALLWILLIALGAAVVALTRQVGILHERLAPVGALSIQRGPEVGEHAPVLEVVDLAGNPVRIGGEDPLGLRTLLFFLSPTCPVCETLLPTLRRVVADEAPRFRLLLASDGDPAEHEGFLRDHGIDRTGYVLSTELGMRLEVAKVPYAVLIDERGIVRAKGIVNTREHLESLFEAWHIGAASIQAYLAREGGAPAMSESGAPT